MKDEVGVSGGGDVFVLGSQETVKIFFIYLNNILQENGLSMPLITERLYKKYVKQSDNLCFLQNLEDIKLLIDKKDGENQYINFINKIIQSVETAEYYYMARKKRGKPYEYQPIFIVTSDLPYSFTQQNVSLEVRDNLTEEDKPFWLRDEDER